MKTKEWEWKQYYELTEIKRTGFSRLSDLDGVADWISNLVHDVVSAIRALVGEIVR
jgi:hypothetical protein